MPAFNAITPEQLDRLIGTPDCPAVVDISLEADFEEDPFLVPGAFRHPHDDVRGLIERLDGRRAVIMCQKGRKLSQGLAAWLRSAGLAVDYLEGGMFGWREMPGAIRVPAAALPPPVGGTTLWVTRHRPKIDRIACPWLIRRFIDTEARFLFVSPGEVAAVAERYGATPFDVEGAPFGHAGERCTFDAMLAAFGLRSEALDRLAALVRAADTGAPETHPAAAGLLAVSVGLSRQYRDDTEQLSAGMVVYDALYRWARDGHEERHDWPGSHV